MNNPELDELNSNAMEQIKHGNDLKGYPNFGCDLNKQ